MNHTWLARAAGLVATIVLVGACSGGGAGATNAPAGSTGGSGGGTSTGGGGGGAGADAGTLNACNLLTTDEIKATVGFDVSAGVVQNSNGQSDCTWNAAGDTGSAVGVTVSNYDDSLWQAGSSAGASTAVTGIGDAAFKGWPHAGDLTIKYKTYQVAVAVLDFQMPAATVDQATLALARIVLPRL